MHFRLLIASITLFLSAFPCIASAHDGLYRVTPSVGKPLLTHGPDPAVSDSLLAPRGAAEERAPSCASDHVQHLLIGHLSGLPDRVATAADGVRRSFRRSNAVLNRDSLASGGPTADFRVKCDAAGEIEVGSFEASSPNFDDVVAGARAAGFADPQSNYTIYLDSPSIGSWCGMASFEGDDRLAADNRNNSGGAYAVVYQPCWDTLAGLHEIAHNQGAVQPDAPNSTGTGGHCNQLLDVVCFAPDGGDRNQVATTACLGEPRFDCGFDDYFDSAPEPGEYLASHWNLGSSLNRFVDFGLGTEAQAPAAVTCRELACAARLPLLSPTEARIESATAGSLHRLRVPRRTPRLRVRLAPRDGLELRLRRGRPPGVSAEPCPASGCRVSDPRSGPWFASVDAEG